MFAYGENMRLNDKSGLGLAIGGACVLIVAMGIGRFAFTAVLPGMMEVYGFDESVAGNMAAWNYAGYLAGVMLVRGVKGKLRYTYFVVVQTRSDRGLRFDGSNCPIS